MQEKGILFRENQNQRRNVTFHKLYFQVFNGDPTQRVTLSPVSLLKVALATVPVTEKDDSFVHFNSIPRSPKFFNSEPSRDFLVPTAKVSRIVNDNGRIHLVNMESDKSRIRGGRDD